VNIKNIILLIAIIFICGCDGRTDVKKFLFEHPDLSFKINGKETVYNKYTPVSKFGRFELSNSCLADEIYFFYIKGEEYELILSGGYKQIGNTQYYVKLNRNLDIDGIKFKFMKPEKQTIKQKKKDGDNMDLSLSTWLLIIVVMLIVAKLAYKLTLRVVIKPIKKIVTNIINEWKNTEVN